MGVLFLNSRPFLGGGELWCSKMCAELCAQGIPSSVGAPVDSPLAEHCISDGIPLFESGSYFTVEFGNRLCEFCKDAQIDYVLMTVDGQGLDVVAINEICTSFESLPPVVLRTGLPPRSGSPASAYGYGLHPKIKSLLVPSKNTKASFLDRYPELSNEYVRVHYTGVVTSADALKCEDEWYLPEIEDSRLIVCVGRLCEQKGQDVLISSLPSVLQKFPDAHVVFAGEDNGVTKSRLETLALAVGAQDAVTFLGHITNVPSLLNKADIFCLPSLSEGLPNALVEAMASGCSCVATCVGGVPEVMNDGQDGLLVFPRDVAGLSRALCQLLGNKEKRERIGSAARKNAQSLSILASAGKLWKNLGDCRDRGFRLPESIGPVLLSRPRRPVGKVIVSHFEGLGDLTLALPLLRALTQLSDEVIVHTRPERIRILRHLGILRSIDPQDPEYEEADLCFDLNLKPNLCTIDFLFQKRCYSFPKFEPKQSRTEVPLIRTRPLWENFLGLLRAFGIPSGEVPIPTFSPIPDLGNSNAARKLLEDGRGFEKVGLAIGGYSSPEKQWGENNFAQLCEILQTQGQFMPVLIAHSSEAPITQQFQDLYDGPYIDLSGQTDDLGILLGVLGELDLLVANDNGVMHLGDAMGRDVLALYGPTDSLFYGPMASNTQIIQAHSGLMQEISVNQVAEDVVSKLKSRSDRHARKI